MACEFCATARMGLHRNLTAAEIVGQIGRRAARTRSPASNLTNYVFMGMGEPLANYPRLARALSIMTSAWGMGISPRRVTVSTVGLVPTMERLLAEFPSVNLAVSLHATTDELRDRLAPINKRYPLEAAYRRVPRPADQAARPRHFRVRDAAPASTIRPPTRAGWCELLGQLKAKVNLIIFNPFPGAPFRAVRARRGRGLSSDPSAG